jgi:RNA polymerase sigma factor (TIGR02999 family)
VNDPSNALTSHLLQRLAAGDRTVESELYARVYEELHERAHQIMRTQPRGHTLQPTALVHEAWLKLADHDLGNVNSQTHFLRLAAKAMRCVLVDHARARAAEKRGGAAQRFSIDDAEVLTEGPGQTFLALDESLERLQASDPELARVAELRLFAGLDHADIARALDVSVRTVERAWKLARTWLQRDLDGQSGA